MHKSEVRETVHRVRGLVGSAHLGNMVAAESRILTHGEASEEVKSETWAGHTWSIFTFHIWSPAICRQLDKHGV